MRLGLGHYQLLALTYPGFISIEKLTKGDFISPQHIKEVDILN